MAVSAPISTLFLALLAARWPHTIQMYQDAVQMLDGVPGDGLSEQAGQNEGTAFEGEPEGKPEVYISDLWSDISSAFEFLENRPMDPELRAKLLADEIELIRMREKAKRLPFTQHTFVRFGKRLSSNYDAAAPDNSKTFNGLRDAPDKRHHIFVRFGKRLSAPKMKAEPRINDNRAVWLNDMLDDKGNFRDLLNVALTEENLNNSPKNREPSFVPLGRLFQSNNADVEQLQTHLPNFHRVRRSAKSQYGIESKPSETSVTFSNPDDAGVYRQEQSAEKRTNSFNLASHSMEQHVSRRFANARIGRLPAAVFYHHWTDSPSEESEMNSRPGSSSRSSTSQFVSLNALPRYG